MREGRPLRFLIATTGGWTVVRAAMLWPGAPPLGEVANAIVPRVEAAVLPTAADPAQVATAERQRPAPAPVQATAAIRRPSAAQAAPIAPAAAPKRTATVPAAVAVPTIQPPLRPTPLARAPGRFAGSAWLIARGGATASLLGGQLGGSQAGARLTYALGDARRFAVAARIATPLAGRGREAAIGIEWKPGKAPLRLIVEQRIAIDGGRGGPSALVVGGIDPTPVAAGFRLEAYAQAGAIARGRVDGFADGAARLTRVVATVGGAAIDIGAGAWGGAQRGAARLDLGPSLGSSLRLGGKPVRLALDYRARVAGAANPGSGIAFSIGSDF